MILCMNKLGANIIKFKEDSTIQIRKKRIFGNISFQEKYNFLKNKEEFNNE